MRENLRELTFDLSSGVWKHNRPANKHRESETRNLSMSIRRTKNCCVCVKFTNEYRMFRCAARVLRPRLCHGMHIQRSFMLVSPNAARYRSYSSNSVQSEDSATEVRQFALCMFGNASRALRVCVCMCVHALNAWSRAESSNEDSNFALKA
jgi:hypothetical protein